MRQQSADQGETRRMSPKRTIIGLVVPRPAPCPSPRSQPSIGRVRAASTISWVVSGSCATRISCCTCRCATRITRGSCRSRRCGRVKSSRPKARSSTPTSSTGHGASSSACWKTKTANRGSRAQLVLRFFHFYPNQQKSLAPGRRVRVFGEVREGHFGLEIVHPQFKVVDAGRAVAGSAHARLSDDRGPRAGDAAQGDRARARVRSRPHRRVAARLARRARTLCGNFPTRCNFSTRRRRGCRASRSRRSTRARIRRGRASSSTSSSRSSSRSRRTGRRGLRGARRC